MSELSHFEIGQTVELNDGRTAILQYTGNTHFAPGDWLGVVLDDATGKNDGSVQGQRYFECRPGHGMFLRPAAATVIDEPTPKPKGRPRIRANGAAAKTRPQSMVAGGLKRQSLVDPGASKRQSINAGSPTPGANGALRARLGVCYDVLTHF
jgi:dynactin 1